MVLDGFRWLWKGLGGVRRGWEGLGWVGRGGEGWGGVWSDPTTPKPRQIVRCLRMLTHARSYLNPLNPLSGIPEGSIDSIGDPLGLDRLDRSGIPEGSIDSIGDPLGGIP